MDNLAKKFLKSWLSFPKRGATDLGVFHPQLLGIKYPSQVYLESHMGNHILEVQGAMANLVAEEEASIPWQSLIFAVPRGVMAWMARASTNCLASPDNLARWKKIVDAKCPLCNISPCTLRHLLSNCKEALDRYEWRHNNIIHYLLKEFASQGLEGREL